MPRIPQGSFDRNPSTRVEATTFSPDKTGVDKAVEAGGQILGAMAKLQDQTERTEAYNLANNTKTQFLAKKAEYESALASVNHEGNFDFIDPNDSNPDITKRKRRTGHISEMYAELQEIHQQGVEKSKNLTRSDIAGELLQQYTGDELLRTNMRTNRTVIKKKQEKVFESAFENIELQFNSILDSVTDASSPELMNANMVKVENSINRELSQIAPIIGEDNYAKLAKHKDNMYSKHAKMALRTGINERSIAAADAMVSRIKNTTLKNTAQVDLERTKRLESTVTAKNTISKAKGVMSKLDEKEHITDDMYREAIDSAVAMGNIYLDDKYTDIKREDVDRQASELIAKATAKRIFQQTFESGSLLGDQRLASLYMSQQNNRNVASDTQEEDQSLSPMFSEEVGDLQDMADDMSTRPPRRDVASFSAEEQAEIDAFAAEFKSISDKISAELDNTTLDGVMKADVLSAAKQKSATNLARLFGNPIKDPAGFVFKNNPNRSKFENIGATILAAENNRLGEPSVIPLESVKAFHKDFTTAIKQGKDIAFRHAAEHIFGAGGGVYDRAVAHDLVDGKAELSYLIPASDNPAMLNDVTEDAHKASMVRKETGITDTNLRDAWDKVKGASVSSIPVQAGIRQAIYNRAIAKSNSKDDLPSAMKEAVRHFEQYHTDFSEGNDNIVLSNDKINFSERNTNEAFRQGLSVAKTAPHIPRETKLHILQSYGEKLMGSSPEDTKELRAKYSKYNTLNDRDLDNHFGRLIQLESAPKDKNVLIFKLNGKSVTDKRGNDIRIQAEDVVNFGNQKKEARREQYSARLRDRYEFENSSLTFGDIPDILNSVPDKINSAIDIKGAEKAGKKYMKHATNAYDPATDPIRNMETRSAAEMARDASEAGKKYMRRNKK